MHDSNPAPFIVGNSPLYYLEPRQSRTQLAFVIVDIDVISLSIPELATTSIWLLSRFDGTSVLDLLSIRGHCAIRR